MSDAPLSPQFKPLLCCGMREVEGFDVENWTPLRWVKSIVMNFPMDTFRRPHLGDAKYAGSAHLVFSTAWDTKHDPYMYRWAHKGYRTKELSLKRIKEFRKYIADNNLGAVTVSPPAYNPNYGKQHKVVAIVWSPDNEELRRFAIKKRWIKSNGKKGPRAATVWV